MCSYQDKKISRNDLLSKLLENLPDSQKSIEQLDNESLNTMDYYKEENTPKNQKLNGRTLNKKKNRNLTQTTLSNEKTNTSISNNSHYSDKNMTNLYESINTVRTSTFFLNEIKKNVQKRNEDKQIKNDYCSKCNSEIGYITKVCPHCFNPLCKKCLKELFNRNVDNNHDIDNFEQNLKERICPNCRNLNSIKDFIVFRSKTLKNEATTFEEPLDTEMNNDIYSDYNKNQQNSLLLKDLEEQYNEYDLLFQKIEGKKKENEIKKKINLNILNIIEKTVEYEYQNNLKK